MKASCRDAELLGGRAVWQLLSQYGCAALLYTHINRLSEWWHAGMWILYQCATEVTRGFVPGSGVAVFTYTYVVHKPIAVDKAFPWKILIKTQILSSDMYFINKRNTRLTWFKFIIPLGKGFFCACSRIFTTSKGVTEKRKTLWWATVYDKVDVLYLYNTPILEHVLVKYVRIRIPLCVPQTGKCICHSSQRTLIQ